MTPDQSILTPGQAMLKNKQLCLRIAQVYPEIEFVIFQLQQNLVTQSNMDSIGPVIYALSQTREAFHALKQKGDPLVEELKKSHQTNTNA